MIFFIFIVMYFYCNPMGSSTEENFYKALSLRRTIPLPDSLIQQIKLILYNIHLCKLKITNRNETEQFDAKKIANICYRYDIVTARVKETEKEIVDERMMGGNDSVGEMLNRI